MSQAQKVTKSVTAENEFTDPFRIAGERAKFNWSIFGTFIAVLDFENADIERRIAIAGKSEGSHDLDKANLLIAVDVINNPCSSRDSYAIAASRNSGRPPSRRI